MMAGVVAGEGRSPEKTENPLLECEPERSMALVCCFVDHLANRRIDRVRLHTFRLLTPGKLDD